MQPPLPSTTGQASLDLPDEAATDALGRVLAAALLPGDTVLLSGPVGAGKTHLVRTVIRTLFGAATEVPSPTFTLVQTYGDHGAAVWHADLYRLGSADELDELGLEAALGRDICLVEWPERLGRRAPPEALRIALAVRGDGRAAMISGGRPGLAAGLADSRPAAKPHD